MNDDLKRLAGIDLTWAEDGTLRFGSDLLVAETAARPLGRLKAVALDPAACVPEDRVQYWMYNGIARIEDRNRLARTGMRYELTLMFPQAIGRERAKTLGHLHSFPEGRRFNYPEVCEVLHGTAYFLFQSLNVQTGTADFCAALEAHPGDKVIIPPNLHHLTINAGDEPLLFSDVIPLAVTGNYAPLAMMHGAAYLYTIEGQFIRNQFYKAADELQHWDAQSYPSLGLTLDRPLYEVFSETPDALGWMLTPERFPAVFPELWQRIESVIAD